MFIAGSTLLLTLSLSSLCVSWVTAAPSTQPAEWVSLGPTAIDVPGKGSMPWSGRITSIAIAGSYVYVGAAGGVVWRLKQGGHSWVPLTDHEPTLAIGSLAVDPRNSKVIYAGTGEAGYIDAESGQGILKTIDGGKSWTVVGSNVFNGQAVIRMEVSPANDKVVYAATDKGVYESEDGGTSWRVLLTNDVLGDTVCDVALCPNNPNVVYAAVPGVGIEKSTNGGSTWTTLRRGLPRQTLQSAKIGISPSDPKILYVALDTSNHAFEFFVSRDDGTSWKRETVAAKGQVAPLLFDEEAVTVDPKDPNHVLLGDRQVFESYNGGRTWNVPMPQTFHVDNHAIVFDAKGAMYIGNDGGVFELSARGALKDLNHNLDITQFYPGLSEYQNGAIILGGTQDNGADIRRGSNRWTFVLTADDANTAINPRNPEQMYTEWVSLPSVFRTNDGGRRWTNITPRQFSAEHPASGFYSLILNPSNPNTLLFGADRVYASKNDGNAWQAISPVFAPVHSGMSITSLAQSTFDPSVIYAGTSTGEIFATFNGGTKWIPQSLPAGTPTGFPVASISITPSDPYRVYASFGGYTDIPYPTRVIYSSNTRSKKSAWVDDTGNLPSGSPINSVLNSSEIVYAATDQGVYESQNGSTKWTKVGFGLPNALVTSILKTPNGTLIVGTHGRGVWELPAGKAF